MNSIPTAIEGCFIIEPKVFGDDRGFFYEAFSQVKFEEKINTFTEFVQDNVAYSKGKVLRGLHFQKGEFAQAKLVGVHIGEVQDVAVDIRKNSPTFGKVVSVNLSGENKRQLFVPRGCAHGYLTLTDEVLFFYKCDNIYNKASEGGLMYDDDFINIEWQSDLNDVIISDKDKIQSKWNELDFDEI